MVWYFQCAPFLLPAENPACTCFLLFINSCKPETTYDLILHLLILQHLLGGLSAFFLRNWDEEPGSSAIPAYGVFRSMHPALSIDDNDTVYRTSLRCCIFLTFRMILFSPRHLFVVSSGTAPLHDIRALLHCAKNERH